MALTEQVKILDEKIRGNKAQYDLDKETAKISALSSRNLEKYEYLTGEDLGYKPDIIQRVKLEYFPLGEGFNKVFKRYYKNKKVIKLGAILLICLMDLILFLTYKIILNTSSKNMKLLQIIPLFKFM